MSMPYPRAHLTTRVRALWPCRPLRGAAERSWNGPRARYIYMDIVSGSVDPAACLRHAREGAGLTQADLAARTGTSQATISAYERGHKQPSVATLSRLLAATGSRLTVTAQSPRVHEPSTAQLERTNRDLGAVLELARALPVRHPQRLRFPRLDIPRRPSP